MAHSHAHHHGHGHCHGPANYDAAFGVGIGLNLAYVIVEAGYGLHIGSLALVADAGHNLSDVIGLALAWGAAVLSKRPPTAKRTYGLRRTSILAALGNAVLLLIAIGAIAWEAVNRFGRPHIVEGSGMMAVAGIGILINAFTALLFMRGRHDDLNVQGAFLHMAADALVSLGVVIAGFLVLKTGFGWIDPVTSLVVVALIAWGTWGLLRQSFDMATDAVPESIDLAAVRNYLEGINGVESIHDLHVWGLSTTEIALTAHLVRPKGMEDAELRTIGEELHEQFGIDHPTIQIERELTGECRTCC